MLIFQNYIILVGDIESPGKQRNIRYAIRTLVTHKRTTTLQSINLFWRTFRRNFQWDILWWLWLASRFLNKAKLSASVMHREMIGEASYSRRNWRCGRDIVLEVLRKTRIKSWHGGWFCGRTP